MAKHASRRANFALLAALGLCGPACTDPGNAKLSQGADAAQTGQALESSTTTRIHLVTSLDRNLCISGSTDNGAKLGIQSCTAPQALWATLPGDGTLRLGGKCLDATDGDTDNGTLVQLWDCAQNNSNQQWSLQNGQILWAGHSLCLDVKDGITGTGSAVQLWACATGNTNQQWLMQAVSQPNETGGTTSSAPPLSTGEPSATGLSGRAKCKRGIAADAGPALRLSAADLKLISPNVTWWYNWYLQPGDSSVVAANAALEMDYVQMVSVATSNLVDLANNMPPQARYLLTFNEPNFNDQANVSPEQAAALWPAIEKIADDHNLLLVGPAMNFCSSGCNEKDPFVWLDKFFAACAGCRVDHIAVHAYTCDLSNLRSMTLDPFVSRYKRPIWLTEFDCADNGAIRNDVSAQKTYMAQVVASLEADPNVFRYAWFMAKSDPNGAWKNIALLDSNGNLTDLGKYYLSLPQNCIP